MNPRSRSISWFVPVMLCLWLLTVTTSVAEESSSAFNDANRHFEQGKYSESIAGYEKLIQSGTVSVPIYFNLGNAFLKSGQVGRAIAAYRKAEKLSPRDPDIRANLQFARDQASSGTPPKRDRWKSLITKLSLNEWAVLATAAVSLCFLSLSARQWKREWRSSFRGAVAVLGLTGALLIVCLIAAYRYESEQISVVIVPEAVVRRGPFEESPSAFTVRDGAELTVLDKKDDWFQVADPAQRTGWMQGRQLMALNPPVLTTVK